MKLQNVIFPEPEATAAATRPKSWDVDLVDGVVQSIAPSPERGREKEEEKDGGGDYESNIASRLLLPTLCHPHLHLDKAYILTACCGGAAAAGGEEGDDDEQPSYADLLPRTGSFAEALRTTAAAKARFTAADLRRRGAQLLATSHRQGVTAARVFVEVDAQAAGRGRVAVDVARELAAAFAGVVDLQVCAFAQEVLFTGAQGADNRVAIEAVLKEEEGKRQASGGAAAVAVLGTTPYVEASRALALQNIEWAVATALAHGLHLDVHLDYNLKEPNGEEEHEPLVFALLDALVRHNWRDRAREARPTSSSSTTTNRNKARTVVVGHATQLTRLPARDLRRLAATISEHDLPVYFVGLPTSDIYMMGRPLPNDPPSAEEGEEGGTGSIGHYPRGTLPVLALNDRFGLRTCLGVNNVGNAFTPYGTGDPLQLACWGVGLYHAGTARDAQQLYGSVSWLAREAIGLENEVDWKKLDPRYLSSARLGPVLIVENERFIQLPGTTHAELGRVPARPRYGFRDVVWDPPDASLRRVL